MRRINALKDSGSLRLQTMTGKVLASGLDDVLQALVHETAAQLKVPIALATLVLERTQFFRAQVGLPAELALAQATDRDASFCQFVVRDGARFEVNDAPADPRVPQELVERHGIRAYLGEPLRIDGQVVGSLCAIDVVARPFSDSERALLGALAVKVSARLEQLRNQRATGAGLSSVVRPAFGELRNVVSVLIQALAAARGAAADLGPLMRLAGPASPGGIPAVEGLTQSLAAFEDLSEQLAIAQEATQRLQPTLFALEQMLVSNHRRTSAAEVVSLASRLAHHHLKLIGGVAWDPVPAELTLATSQLVGVSVVGAALSQLAEARPGKLTGSVASEGEHVVFAVRPEGLAQEQLEQVSAGLGAMFGQDPLLTLEVARGCLLIRFARAGSSLPR